MASAVKGYQKAAKRYRICAVCGVGMGASGSQLREVRKANAIPEAVPLFTLQGGFDITKLRGVYKLMMTVMVKTAGKALADRKDRRPGEDNMPELLRHSSRTAPKGYVKTTPRPLGRGVVFTGYCCRCFCLPGRREDRGAAL